MKIIDNFLTPSYADALEDQFLSPQQEWFFNRNASYLEEEEKFHMKFGFQFHVFRLDVGFSDTKLTYFLKPLLFQIQDAVKCTNLLKCRIDMTMASGTKVIHDPHIDIPFELASGINNYITTIYYTSDSDGDTVLYNEFEESDEYTVMDTVTPKKNRLLIFEGRRFHTGHSPMLHQNRVLINSNFIL